MSRRAAWARRGLRATYALDLAGGLPAADAVAVLAVAIRGRLTPGELAELAGCSRRVATDRLRRLADARWIERSVVEAEVYEPLAQLARVARESVGASP